MPLPDHDTTLYHIGLQPAISEGGWKGFMLTGAYRRDLQRTAPQGGEYGGSQDLIEASTGLARLTQDEFVGGAYQYQWGKDNAMFAESRNIIPNPQGNSVYTVPPLYQFKLINQTDDTGYSSTFPNPVAMWSWNGYLFIIFRHIAYRLQLSDGTLTSDTFGTEFDGGGDDEWITDAAFDSNDRIIWAIREGEGALESKLLRRDTDLGVPATQPIYSIPNSTSRDCIGLEIYGSFILVSVGQVLYAFDPPENKADADQVGKWTKIGRLPGRWKASLVYSNQAYILTQDADNKTRLVTFDGTQINPVCDFPFNFQGRCMAQYGGRIFVGGSGTDINGGDRYAELFEVTGASVRLVRTFAPESYAGIAAPKSINDLAVAEGLLWFYQKDSKMIAYDLTTDGFFGASQTQIGAGGDFWKFVVGREKLYGWFTHTTPGNNGIYRVAASGDVVSSYDGEIVTSDFCMEPALSKSWSTLTTLSRYGGVGMDVSYDGGDNWQNIVATTTETEGELYTTTFDLQFFPSKHVRFKFYLARGTNVTAYTEFIAYTLQFAFLETGKRTWQFTILGSSHPERIDGTMYEQDIHALDQQLWEWAREKTTLMLWDLDGVNTAIVNILSLSEHQPIVGPPVPILPDGDQSDSSRPEAFYSITLVEV